MMRSLVEDLSHTTHDPGDLLAQINRGLATVFKQTGATLFATAFYLIADVGSGELRYASAAHPDALHLCRAQGRLDALDSGNGRKGPALGLFPTAEFPTCSRALNAGDLVMLFTDGLTEAEGRDHECFTQERLAAAVRQRVHLPTGQMLKQVLAEIRNFSETGEFSDDASLVGIEIKRLGIAAPVR
jgi:serine phosphatase RsbU (regulator of sigma subunit)